MRKLIPRAQQASQLVQRFADGLQSARELAESELHAAALGLPIGRHGSSRFRKWLGWRLFRFAAWINPDVADS